MVLEMVIKYRDGLMAFLETKNNSLIGLASPKPIRLEDLTNLLGSNRGICLRFESPHPSFTTKATLILFENIIFCM